MKTPFISQLLLSVAIGFWPGLFSEITTALSKPTTQIVDSTREFSVQPFDRIKITETLTITVKEGAVFAVKAVGRPEDINTLTTSVKKGLLTISYEPIPAKKNQNIVINREEVKLTITLPTLKQAEFQKSAQFTISGFDQSKILDLVLNSLASGSATISAEHVKLTLDSHSSLILRGETTRLDATLQGQSTLTAFDLKASEATLHWDGMSKADVSVSHKLQAAASGSSEVIYKGKPAVKMSENDSSFIREQAR